MGESENMKAYTCSAKQKNNNTGGKTNGTPRRKNRPTCKAGKDVFGEKHEGTHPSSRLTAWGDSALKKNEGENTTGFA